MSPDLGSSYALLAWIVAVPAIVMVQIYLLGCKMSEPEKMMKPLAGGFAAYQQQALMQYKDWLASENLEYQTSFRFGVVQTVVFQQRNEPRFFSFMFHKKLSFAVETYLEDLTILDTSTSGSGNLFPRPGAYAQSFPNVSPQEAWRRHLEGEKHLTKKFGFRWLPLKRPYEEILLDAIRLRMTYNRSQAFWPFRVLCRYAVTRFRVTSRTIAQQFP